MALQFIYGRSASCKTAACMQTVQTWLEQSTGNVVWMVPEQYSLETERMLSHRLGTTNMSRVDVLSFERMAKRVFSMVGPALYDYIDDCGKQMLLEKTVLKLEKKLTVLSRAARQTGFVRQLLPLMNEFKRSGITPDTLRQTASELNTPMLAFKLTDLALLLEQYQTQFQPPVMDSEDDVVLLKQKIEQHALFADSLVVMDHYDGFSPTQLNVLEQLLLNARSLLVALRSDGLQPGQMDDPFYQAKMTAQQLLALAREHNITVDRPIAITDCDTYKDRPDLAHLERYYFESPAVPYEWETTSLRIHAAAHYAAEAEQVARTIRRLCREHGYRFRDMAVLTRSREVYEPLLRAAFAKFDIPCYVAEALCPLDHFVVRGLLALFDIAETDFRRDAVVEWIKSGLCGIEQQDAFLLEQYLLAAGVTPTQWKQDEQWTYDAGLNEAELKRVNEAKERVKAPVLAFLEQFSGRKTVLEIITAYGAFLTQIEAEQTVLDWADRLEQDGQPQQAVNLLESYRALVKTLNQMALLLGDEQMSFEKFATVLKTGLAGLEIGRPPNTVDELEITDVERFRSQGAKCVFVMGLIDGVFPHGYLPEGLLSDRERNAIGQTAGVTLETTVTRHANEYNLIYTALTAATERLFLSYSLADQEGDALLPSAIITRVEALFPYVDKQNDLFVQPDSEDYIEGVYDTFHRLVASPQTGVWAQAASWYRQHQPGLYDVLKQAKQYTNHPQQLRDDLVTLLYGDTPYISVSRAEQFARCRFAYFVRYGLRVEPQRVHEIRPVDVGNIMHQIIERFSHDAAEAGWDNMERERCSEWAHAMTQQVLSQTLSKAHTLSPRYRHMVGKMASMMDTTLWHITQYYQNTGFVPLGYEMAFDGTDLPTIEVNLDDGRTARLTGKIDRVDVWRTEHGDYISVVDYKSGAKDIDYTQVLAGMQIQLPTYIDAVCTTLSKQQGIQAMPAAMLYYTISDPVLLSTRDASDEQLAKEVQKQLRMRGLALIDEQATPGLGTVYSVKPQATSAQIEKLCKVAHRQLKQAVQGLMDGRIDINPARFSGKTSCDFCDYRSVCGFDLSYNRYRNLPKLTREEFFDHA